MKKSVIVTVVIFLIVVGMGIKFYSQYQEQRQKEEYAKKVSDQIASISTDVNDFINSIDGLTNDKNGINQLSNNAYKNKSKLLKPSMNLTELQDVKKQADSFYSSIIYLCNQKISMNVLEKTASDLIEKIGKNTNEDISALDMAKCLNKIRKIYNGAYQNISPKKDVIYIHEPAPAHTSQVTSPNNSGIIEASQWRKLNDTDLYGLSAWQLNIARNEIYARHGRPFIKEQYRQYFRNQSWYQENPNYSDSELSSTERYNANLIANYQRSHNLE